MSASDWTLVVGALLGVCLVAAANAQETGPLPEVVVDRDDLRIERSCRLVVPRVPDDPVLVDDEGDGLVHVVADGVRVEFGPGTVLRGAPVDAWPDELTGVGLRLHGVRDVTLVGARLSGFQVGVWATDCDGLVLEDVEVTDGFRQRLGSTAAVSDDGSDWLAPHDNDADQWRIRYGAALVVEDSRHVTVSGCLVRRVQNGLILDRVEAARVHHNDFSFLSGWGIACWRTRTSLIARNALDFCVRGYSHGVYNRGQDSAGLLLFEQCHDNLVVQNSITHGGDGVFAFAGREALGEAGPADLDRLRRGHLGNLFLENDLSFAAAHGLELTFSFDNRVESNRFEGNAICGVWGGYSQGTVIARNRFERNGEAGYGLERGGVNIEHGRENVVFGNDFSGNACGVHLWWDADEHLASLPWVAANGAACADNVVRANRFSGDAVGIQLRDAQRTALARNVFRGVAVELDASEGAVGPATPTPRVPRPPRARSLLDDLPAGTHPGGDRSHLRSREHILMTAWGPWDHGAPALRPLERAATRHAWQVLGDPVTELVTAGDGVCFERNDDELVARLAEGARGVFPYSVEVVGGRPPRRTTGVLLAAAWDVVAFPWTNDPREDEAAWRAESRSHQAVRATLPELSLAYGWRGTDLLAQSDADPALEPAHDRFGTLAETRLPLTAGRWRLVTLSDDGVRVIVDGENVLENWTWHGPTRDQALLTLEQPRDVHIRVEHFELDGYAVLSLDVLPVD